MALPNGYTRIEYIQSTGTQVINTEYKPNNNTRMVLDIEGSSSQTAANFLYGTTDNTSYYRGGMISNGSWELYCWYGAATVNTTFSYGSGANYAARKTIDFDKNVLTINGASKTLTANTFSVAYPLVLFCYNQAGTYSMHSAAKLYSCKIYDNGTLVRDFIPCKNAAGTVGLWDDVNSAFYTNAGTGTFTAGAEIIGNHYTLINGTAYEFSEGSAMISGTAYDISKGLVMDGGTVYEIDFAGGPYIITITGTGDYRLYVTINGVQYQQAATLEVPAGTAVNCTITSANRKGSIYLNDTSVASASYYDDANYTHLVGSNLSIALWNGTSPTPYIKLTETR